MYEKAKLEEEVLQQHPNPFEETKLIDMEDKEFDDEVKDLLEWSDNLDFDKFYREWTKLSTSDGSEKFCNSLKIDKHDSKVSTMASTSRAPNPTFLDTDPSHRTGKF
jgi:hypothetical protein